MDNDAIALAYGDSSYQRACRDIGIDPSYIPDLTAPGRRNEPIGDPFFRLVEPISDAEWACLRQAIPPGRRGDAHDKQFLEALLTLVRHSESVLNWTLLKTPYGTSTAVRMRWLRNCETGRFTELAQHAEAQSLNDQLKADLRKLALYSRGYTERITRQRSLRVLNERTKGLKRP